MLEETDLKRTCLYDVHIELNARMSPFGGWMMPVQYAGIMKEHTACRECVALFDTDHMGEFIVDGQTALSDLENIISCDVASISIGQCRYGMMCNAEGGVIDDLLVYRQAEDKFMVVVNAGTKDGDVDWIREHISDKTSFEDISAVTAKIDVQGPKSPGIIQKLTGQSVEGLKFYHFMDNSYKGNDVIVSRTGYTGEMGFEVYLASELAESFWKDCMDFGAVPAGLGARDTLRLEMGMPLYGHELNTDRNAGESGFDRAISANKSFIGSSVVNDLSSRKSKLIAIKIQGRRAARHSDEILDCAGNKIGVVTSGSFSPSLGCAIALGYVDTANAAVGTKLVVKAARDELYGEVVEMPIYTEATGRLKVADLL